MWRYMSRGYDDGTVGEVTRELEQLRLEERAAAGGVSTDLVNFMALPRMMKVIDLVSSMAFTRSNRVEQQPLTEEEMRHQVQADGYIVLVSSMAGSRDIDLVSSMAGPRPNC